MKEILISNDGKTRQEIAKAFGVSDVTVRNALKGRVKTPLGHKIRELAKQKGGVESVTN